MAELSFDSTEDQRLWLCDELSLTYCSEAASNEEYDSFNTLRAFLMGEVPEPPVMAESLQQDVSSALSELGYTGRISDEQVVFLAALTGIENDVLVTEFTRTLVA